MKHRTRLLATSAATWLMVAMVTACGEHAVGGGGGGGQSDAASDVGPGDAGSTDTDEPDVHGQDTASSDDTGGGDPNDPGPFEWPSATAPIAITASPDLDNTLDLPADPFVVTPDEGGAMTLPRWIKFAVLIADPSKVWYHNSKKYPLHVTAATKLLDPFKGWSAKQFDDATLYAKDQQAILGAVLLPPRRQAA